MTSATDGAIGFFTGLAAEAWRLSKPDDITAEEAAYVASRLGLARRARLLDVPCGDGRLALALAAMGPHVTGIDGSGEALARARLAGGTRCAWIQADMAGLAAALAGSAPFDGACCFGNSLGYLDRRGTAGFLQAIAAVLRPGARLVIDTEMTAESVLPNFADRLWTEVGDILMLVEHRYRPDEAALDTEYRFMRGGTVEHACLRHFVFTCGELVAMLDAAGLDVVALERDLEGEPFGPGDPRLLLTAARRPRRGT